MALKLRNLSSPFIPHLHIFSLNPPNPTCLHIFSRPQTPISLSHSTNNIFLPLLEEEEKEQKVETKEEEQEETDPILKFFKSLSKTPDPDSEGRLSLQKNRRSSWHLADVQPIETESKIAEQELDFLAVEEEAAAAAEEEEEGRGVAWEILRIARNLPENSTLSEHLSPFIGRLGEVECIEALELMEEEGLVLSCLYLFEWMGIQEPSMLSPRAYSILFPLLGKKGMGEKIVILFENMPAGRKFRDVHVYNAAISSLSHCRRYNDAWKVYEKMENNNIQPDHVTCSILITVMRKSGSSAKDAWQFFERMNRKGVKLSMEVLGALIKSFCEEGLMKQALVIQAEMGKRGISSNTIIYNTLMDAFCKSNQIEEAEALFIEMKKELKPTAATYNILMDAYSRRMLPETVEDLLWEMQGLGLEPDVKSYTCLISAYGRQKKMSDRAADAFLRMKKAGIKPTSHSYTALIHAFSVDGWHEKAYITFDNMKREGITPSIETYTALLDAFRRAGNTEKLMEIWKSMIKDEIEGTRITFNTLVDGFAKQGCYASARDVISEFGRIGLQPTVMTYNMLMNAYARGGQHLKLPQLLREMAALDLKPDSITYSTMIYAYIRVRDFKRAFYYHKQMVKMRQVPDAKSYEKLRAILEAKAKIKNRRDRSAILGIINSNIGQLKPRRGKKDEFWKNKKKRSQIGKLMNT